MATLPVQIRLFLQNQGQQNPQFLPVPEEKVRRRKISNPLSLSLYTQPLPPSPPPPPNPWSSFVLSKNHPKKYQNICTVHRRRKRVKIEKKNGRKGQREKGKEGEEQKDTEEGRSKRRSKGGKPEAYTCTLGLCMAEGGGQGRQGRADRAGSQQIVHGRTPRAPRPLAITRVTRVPAHLRVPNLSVFLNYFLVLAIYIY